MSQTLSTEELVRLVQKVFGSRVEDRRMALLIDLPDDRLPDSAEWADRRTLAADWWSKLTRGIDSLGLDTVDLIGYRNVRSNNADLPDAAWCFGDEPLPDHADRVDAAEVRMETVLGEHDILIALTELSATAPMKIAAPRFGFRAATMPGFTRPMIPALRLDWEEIHRRCVALERRLDRADGAELRFVADGRESELCLDLRHRRATASGGRVHEPGTAGNLPSGETYIVPYEGEIEGDPSRSAGLMPVRLEGELLFYRIEGNRAVEVEGSGPVAEREALAIRDEPAYANLAEFGLGLLGDYGIRPVGRILLDEKLAPHIAFGRSDHFGGQIGPGQFSAPEKVVHIDRVYLPEMQPGVRVVEADLLEGGQRRPLIRDGAYV